MKKLIFLIFISLTPYSFGQIYFDYPTENQVFQLNSNGRVTVEFKLDNEQTLYVSDFQHSLTYPNGTNYGYVDGQTGGWVLSTTGEYSARGRGWGTPVGEIGGGYSWYYTYAIPFYVNPAPQPLTSVSISGPTSLPANTNGTWQAHITGGIGSLTCQWYYEYPGGGATPIAASNIQPDLPPSNTWYPIGSNSSVLNAAFVQNVYLKCVVTDSQNTVVTSNILSITITY